MFYIYILYSRSANKYYIGSTGDYQRRLSEHNATERNTYTSKYRPWELAAVFECGDNLSQAIRIERFIKKQKSRAFIEKLIASECFKGELAQLVRVPNFRD